MKQAILITAYKNFDHLYDLVVFFDARFEIYIHIDKKSNISNQVIERLRAVTIVKFISRKYKVNWGGLNHLKSILLLSSEALKNNQIRTFHLITGHDYPIKPTNYFIDFFKENSDVIYLPCYKLPTTRWEEGGLNRLYYYNLYDVIDAKKYRKYIYKFVQFQKKINFKRKISKKTPQLYGGETYWTLSREALNYVVDYSQKNVYLLKRFRHTFCAEEIYFQTVIMNSKFKDKITSNSLRYIDWTGRNGNMPSNLDLSDLEKIKNTNSLFARKFEFPISTELKIQLNRYLNSNNG